jgi:hypothetical protein
MAVCQNVEQPSPECAALGLMMPYGCVFPDEEWA